MKTSLDKFFILIAFICGIFVCVASKNMPTPNPNGRTNNGLPPPPGLPIDEGIYVLFVVGLLYAFYFIYKYQLRNKTAL